MARNTAPIARTIDGTVFVIGFIAPLSAPGAFKKLTKIGGPLLTEVVALVKDGGDVDIGAALSGGKLDRILERIGDIDDKQLVELMMTLAEATTVDGVTLSKSFNIVFAGRFDVMVQWFIESCKVNFGSFLQSTAKAG